jgi:GxxExxY protein
MNTDTLNELNRVSSRIIGAAMNVHNGLGPGLLESVYGRCMIIELEKLGLKVESEVCVPITYEGNTITEEGFRMDLLVEDRIVVELKSVEKIQPVHQKQLLTYLRLAKKPLGLLINFNESMLKNGITRIINSRQNSVSHTGHRDLREDL